MSEKIKPYDIAEITCRGCIELGTACGECKRCLEEKEKRSKTTPTVYDKAIIKFGVDSQINMLIEEMSELTTALMHMKRGRVHNVPEEFVDVGIMMRQLLPIFNIDGSIDDWETIKVEELKILVG